MKKILLVFLALATIANLVILVIALTDESSIFYNYRLVVGISFLMFAGFFRQLILSYRKIKTD